MTKITINICRPSDGTERSTFGSLDWFTCKVNGEVAIRVQLKGSAKETLYIFKRLLVFLLVCLNPPDRKT